MSGQALYVCLPNSVLKFNLQNPTTAELTTGSPALFNTGATVLSGTLYVADNGDLEVNEYSNQTGAMITSINTYPNIPNAAISSGNTVYISTQYGVILYYQNNRNVGELVTSYSDNLNGMALYGHSLYVANSGAPGNVLIFNASTGNLINTISTEIDWPVSVAMYNPS